MANITNDLAAPPAWKRGGNPVGTFLQREHRVPFSRLIKVFGEPQRLGSDGDKVAFEWVLEFFDGTVATVHDYKASSLYCDELGAPTPEQMRAEDFDDWHIGGKTPMAVHYVLSALKGAMTLPCSNQQDIPYYMSVPYALYIARSCEEDQTHRHAWAKVAKILAAEVRRLQGETHRG